MTKKVLFLYENMGFGHRRIAEVIEKALKEKYPSIKTESLDVVGAYHPWVVDFIRKTYFIALKYLPSFWNFIYHSSNKHNDSKFFINLSAKLTKSNFKEIIEKFKPDVVVCTYALSAGAVSLIKKENPGIFLIAVTTDFYSHSSWIHKNIDLYCVATKKSARNFINKGINKKNIVITGLPVENKFFKKTSKLMLRKKLGFDENLPLILIAGGGFGLGNLDKIIAPLDSFKDKIQLAVITGVNEKLFKKLKKRKFNQKMKIFGFVDNIDEFMGASDLYIGKAGGSATAELFAKRLPFVIYGSLPGQEKTNIKFLLSNKAGYIAHDEKELLNIVDKLLNDKNEIKKCQSNIRKISMDNSTDKIVEIIYKVLKSKKRID